MLDDIEQLRVFVQIVQSGTMTAAARALSLQPNTVSRRVAALEEAVGRTLLVRTTRRVQMSEEGRRFYEHARRILSAVQSAEQDLQSGAYLRGRLRLGLGTQILGPRLLQRLAAMMHENPELSISVAVSDEPFDIVGAGVDLVVVAGPQPDSSLVATRLATVYSGLAAHQSYLERAGVPRRRDDLIDHQCLLFGHGAQRAVWRLTDRQGAQHEVRVGGRFVSNNSRVLSDALSAGVGIGLGQLPLGAAANADGLVRVLPSYRFGPMPIYAVMPQGVASTAPVRAVLQILREDLGQQAGDWASS